MKKLFVALMVVCSLMGVKAQNQEDSHKSSLDVNLDSIESFVSQNKDVHKALLDRHIAGDTTLTIEECAIVYYGYCFNPVYDGDYVPTTEAEGYFREGKYDKARSIFEKSLSVNPVSLRTIFKSMVCAYVANDTLRSDVLKVRFAQLANVILSSGDGCSVDSGFWVLEVSDEYAILYDLFRVEKVNSQALIEGKNGPCDKMNVTIDGKEMDLYFNVSLSMLKLQRMFGKK